MSPEPCKPSEHICVGCVFVALAFISLYIRQINWSPWFGVMTEAVRDLDVPLHPTLVKYFARYDTDRRSAACLLLYSDLIRIQWQLEFSWRAKTGVDRVA